MMDAGGDVLAGGSGRRAVEDVVATPAKQLIDLSGRNRLLFYRDLKVGTIDFRPLAASSSERSISRVAPNGKGGATVTHAARRVPVGT